MWEINNTEQVLGFIYSVLLGCLYCIIYDIIRSCRATGKPTILSMLIEDVVFSLACAMICFCFLLSVTNGEIRVYVIFGIIIGFFIFRMTISKVLTRILKVIIKAIRLSFSFIIKILNIILTWLNKLIDGFVIISEKIFKRIRKTLKKLLKNISGLMYTKEVKID